MIVDLAKIELDIIAIHEKSVDDSTGMEWQTLAKYIGICILEGRIDQEFGGTPPVSDLTLELAKIKGG